MRESGWRGGCVSRVGSMRALEPKSSSVLVCSSPRACLAPSSVRGRSEWCVESMDRSQERWRRRPRSPSLPRVLLVQKGRTVLQQTSTCDRETSPTPDCTLDPRTAVEQLQLLVRTVRQRLVRLAQVERDGRLGARRDERVEDDQVVELAERKTVSTEVRRERSPRHTCEST